jgi:hypothetical protein
VAPTSTTLALPAERLGVRITFGGPAASGEAGGVLVTDAAPEAV